jgi:hypothetical protein
MENHMHSASIVDIYSSTLAKMDRHVQSLDIFNNIAPKPNVSMDHWIASQSVLMVKTPTKLHNPQSTS